MAKRLTENQKEEIKKGFFDGKTIDDLSVSFKCTNFTIIRNLKKNIGETRFKEILEKNKSLKKSDIKEKSFDEISKINFLNEKTTSEDSYKTNLTDNFNENIKSTSPFLEIAPLDYEIDNTQQNDFSSVPISEVDFPSIVYMIVDKKIELVNKYLKEYPEWQFLAQEELERKTIEIFSDLKEARKTCNKEQKVIKVTNTNVFKICASLLLEKGISRIVSVDKLIAL